ncbi:serine/threonine-protein kinase [Neomesorhizobium albiziae]|uniref:serine/threonine-protein kinase n=1 Tax=Neomesorhizobium albiziae TaxID=335020 RepID=UPI00235CA1D5|nr:serine/threonine protein kinase [Mesorhizobium albiziae]
MSDNDDKTRILPDMAKTGVGTQLSGIYELDERIACGGMGEVYRGHNIQTGDHVAIKIVLPEFARDQTILSLFRKEATILNHLSHDAIVRYHVFTIDPGIGRPYLAMEFVDGQSLFDVMRRGAMSTEDVRKLCHRLASGLSFVHEAGAVHRDLSPDNVILPGGKVERAKIIDFGIARSATVGGETLIGGKFAGKYNYVSPEQLGLYGGEVSERSDIYSLGLVLAAALRGQPLEMSGSQFEIVEKRRVVPDLSGIDEELRPMIEEMLQPDPHDRPTAAEIAEMTRSVVSLGDTLTPRSKAPRERGTVQPQPVSPDPWVETGTSSTADDPAAPPAPPKATEEPNFVPHRPPALLSQPRPAAVTPPVRPPTPPPATNIRNMVIAAAAAMVVLLGGGAYFGGFLTPPPASNGDAVPQLTPDLSKPETVAPTSQPVENTTPPETQTQNKEPPSGETASGQNQDASLPVAPAANSQTGSTPPALPTGKTSDQPESATSPADVRPETEVSSASSAKLRDNSASQGEKGPQSETAGQPPATPPTNKTATNQPKQSNPTPIPDRLQPKQLETTANQGSEAPRAGNAPTAANDQPTVTNGQVTNPASDGQGDTNVAINIPEPGLPTLQPDVPTQSQPPTKTIDGVAQRISWLRDYIGGDCFYAAATSATDKAIEIEGFGTTVEPFMQMLEAFRDKFQLEPDVSVRLIEPAQCEVTQFLHALGPSSAEKPHLSLAQTSVPDGSPVSGTLEIAGGSRASLLLIDHKGMVFNLDERVVVEAGKASFSIPIGLGDADKASGKAVPQIIIAVIGSSDIDAATFSNPVPATVAFPKILAEIREKGGEFSATAKYFQLGG